jgi:hypothetical protein
MTKYYRVVKDHPIWEVGTILSNEKDERNYYPISDVFVKEIEGLDDNWYEDSKLIENQSEWFERVYEMSQGSKLVFVTKEKAKEMASKFFVSK